MPFDKTRIIKSTFKKEGLIHLSGTSIKFKSQTIVTQADFDSLKQVRIVPKAKTKSKNTEFVIEIVKGLSKEQQNQILQKTKENKANQAISRHVKETAKLDEQGKPIVKTFKSFPRGVRKTDSAGNKIIPAPTIKHVTLTEKIEEIQLDINHITPVGIDLNNNNIAVGFFNPKTKTDESFLIETKYLKHLIWRFNKDKARLQSRIENLIQETNMLKLLLAELKKDVFVFKNVRSFAFCLQDLTLQEIITHNNEAICKLKNKLRKLNNKRNKKLDHALHSLSRKLVDKLNNLSVNTLIIGKNKGWKNEINLGDKTNQLFGQVPFAKLIDRIIYKANRLGMHVVLTEESFTSKTSFYDKEKLESFNQVKSKKTNLSFIGKRIKRGLFQSPNRKALFHADINAKTLHLIS